MPNLPAAPLRAAQLSSDQLLQTAALIVTDSSLLPLDIAAARLAAQARLRMADYNRYALESSIIPHEHFLEREHDANQRFALALDALVQRLSTFSRNTGLGSNDEPRFRIPLLSLDS